MYKPSILNWRKAIIVKILIGGSPCTHWSVAQKNNRETEAKGLGWELFQNYLIAKEKFKPDYFLYENNKSAAPAIKYQIAKELGVETDLKARFTYINSALVSAQNRQRFYVTNFGDIKQPKDRGVLVKDILETGNTYQDKAHCLTASYNGAVIWNSLERGQRSMIAEPVCVAQRGRYVGDTKETNQKFEARADGKTNTLTTVLKDNNIAEMVDCNAGQQPVCMRYERSDEAKAVRKQYEAGEVQHGFNELRQLHPRTDGKTNTLTTVLKDNPICEPVRVGDLPNEKGEISGSQATRIYSLEGKSVNLIANGGGQGAKTGLYAIPVADKPERIGLMPNLNGEISNSQGMRLYSTDGKSISLTANGGGFGQSTGLYAISVEFDGEVPIRAMSNADGKTYPVYLVQSGKITIKEKQYPIKLEDGYYIIRKLTVTEASRLQTMPDDYCRAVSASQAYRGLGNGWTAEVIIHLLQHMNVPLDEEIVVLSMYDGIGTGRYCLDKMGYKNVKYYATEIDKYAMQISNSNYPDIVQLGDAFQVREDNWKLPIT